MRLTPGALVLTLFLALGAAANEPIWTLDQRRGQRDAVFAGRVESTERLYETDVKLAQGYEGDLTEEVWLARVEVLDIRKGHRLLEAGPVVDVYFVRPGHGVGARCPTYVEVAPGDEKVLYAQAALYPVTGDEALFLEMGNDVVPAGSAGPGAGRRLVTGDWRVWSTAFSLLPRDGYPIHFYPSGHAWSENLAGVERWELAADGTLELLAESGTVYYRFKPRPDDLFVHVLGEDASRALDIWLGPEGLDFFDLVRASQADLHRLEVKEPLIHLPRGPAGLRAPVPEVVEELARQGIRLEPSSAAGGLMTEYTVTEPSTSGFRVTLRIWKFPADWTDDEIQDHLLPYSLGRVVNGRYVLWWPRAKAWTRTSLPASSASSTGS